jgi:hypothetical protein
MKPIDFRNETFADLQGRIAGLRAVVLDAWRKHGPCTTEELAERSEISILSLRPRTTELYQLGFLTLAEDQERKGEGRYRARTEAELDRWFHQQRREALLEQRELALGV